MPIVNPYAKRKVPPSAPASERPVGTSSSAHQNGGGGSNAGSSSNGGGTTRAPGAVAAGTPTSVHLGASSSSAAGDAAAANNSLPLDDQQNNPLIMMDAQPHLLYVSTRQRGNALLRYVRNVPWAYTPMVPDYVWSTTRCALFLSVKYHGLHPNYLRSRIGELGSDFTCRVLLVLVDVQDCANLLLQINVMAVRHGLTVLLAWSDEEAARYLETFKAMDGKDASLIQRQLKSTFCEQAIDVMVEGGVNKTDAGQLLSQFGTMRSLVMATPDELGLVVGMGPVKVQRLHDAFHKPFSTRAAAERKRKAKDMERLKDEEAKEAVVAPATDDANETEAENYDELKLTEDICE